MEHTGILHMTVGRHGVKYAKIHIAMNVAIELTLINRFAIEFESREKIANEMGLDRTSN